MAVDLALSYRAPATARAMADAAANFLDALNVAQRAAASFPFTGDERYEWNYRPTPRNGLRLMNMTREQQGLALALVDAGMSARGAEQTRWIMTLDDILREHERQDGRVFLGWRDAEYYWFSVFGDPRGDAPWGWRVGGHHVGLHFTIVDRETVAPTPCFLGANPSQVRYGEHTGTRALPEEEDLPRALVQSLSGAAREQAIFSENAPQDIMTDAYRSLDRFLLPRGVAYRTLDGEQRTQLVGIVKHYIGRVANEVAGQEWEKIEQAGLDGVTFAWGGATEKGTGHYYAIQGPTFIVEYDNTQNDANHIHSVWRTFAGDWGEDILAQHYASAHR
ncbi:MAG: DUF3500 domain-containing protein [Chloroflexi bacterium]|nr:DUF3500 domain-containing protein [Chloroflexota bacterium]